MKYTVRPISDWTVFNNSETRQPNPFRATWTNTLKLLGRELDLLDATNVVFEISCREADIRLDGMLYAKAKVDHPGVRVAFDSIYGPLSYATDRYAGRWSNDPPDWQINVRAIALGLEALRAVDRYGVTRRGEQYTGFKALPAGRAMPASHMTTSAAAELLRSYAPVGDSLESAWKAARRAAHPDRHGGVQAQWDRVEEAATVLGLLA